MKQPRAFYNEIDPYAAEWLRNLIMVGLIAPGDVDERSIEDVTPGDLRGYTQCHFFAGIGGWSLALRLAGWPDDREVWTGSCPCQPFSAAGKGKGTADERHLWPAWYHLIGECRPRVVFGEQVEAAIKHDWLDLVQSDLEGIGYAVGPVGLPAAGVGAPHIRQRLWWVAERMDDTTSTRRQRTLQGPKGDPRDEARLRLLGEGRRAGVLAHGGGARLEGHDGHGDDCHEPGRVDAHATGSVAASGGVDALADTAHGDGRRGERGAQTGVGQDEERRRGPSSGSAVGGMADDDETRRRLEWSASLLDGKRTPQRHDADGCSAVGSVADANHRRASRAPSAEGHAEPGCVEAGAGGEQFRRERPSPTNGFWRDADWLFCRDGKWRPVEPGTFPLAHGAPARVGRLRAYGNAIVAPLAAEVIRAYMECRP